MEKTARRRPGQARYRSKGIISVLLTMTMIVTLWPLNAYSATDASDKPMGPSASASYDKAIFIDEGLVPDIDFSLFASERYELEIDRDYDQRGALAVANNGDRDVVFYLKLVDEQPPDLSFGFIEQGSTEEEPAFLLPGESMDVAMTFFAQNASIQERDISVAAYMYSPESGTFELCDVAVLHLSIQGIKPMQLGFVQGATNATTLATEYTFTNTSDDDISDFTVSIFGEISDYARTSPIISNYYLSAGESITFKVVPELSAALESGKEVFEGTLVATGLGDEQSYPVSFSIAGQEITTLSMGDIALMNDDNPFFNLDFDNFEVVLNTWEAYGDAKTEVTFDALYGFNQENKMPVTAAVSITNLGEPSGPVDYEAKIDLVEKDGVVELRFTKVITLAEYEDLLASMGPGMADAGMNLAPLAEGDGGAGGLSNETSFAVDIMLSFESAFGSMAGLEGVSKFFDALGLSKAVYDLSKDMRNAYCVYDNPNIPSNVREEYLIISAFKTVFKLTTTGSALLTAEIPLISLAVALLGSYADYIFAEYLDGLIKNPCDVPAVEDVQRVEGAQCTNRGYALADFFMNLPNYDYSEPDLPNPISPFSIGTQGEILSGAAATDCCLNPNCGAKRGLACTCEGCTNPCASGGTATVGTVVQYPDGTHHLVPDIYVLERMTPTIYIYGSSYTIRKASSVESGTYTDVLNGATASIGSYKGTGQSLMRYLPSLMPQGISGKPKLLVSKGGTQGGYTAGTEMSLVSAPGKNSLKRVYSTMPVSYYVTTETKITSLFPLDAPYSLIAYSNDIRDLPDYRQLPDFSIKPYDIYVNDDKSYFGATELLPTLGAPTRISFEVFNEGARSGYCTVTAYVDGIEVYRMENDYISRLSSKTYDFEYTPLTKTSEVTIKVEATGGIFHDKDTSNNQASAILQAREPITPSIKTIYPSGNFDYMPSCLYVYLKDWNDISSLEFCLDGVEISDFQGYKRYDSYGSILIYAWVYIMNIEASKEHELTVKITYYTGDGTTATIEETTTFSWPMVYQVPSINSISPSGQNTWTPRTASAAISNGERIRSTSFFVDGYLVDTLTNKEPVKYIPGFNQKMEELGLEAGKEHELTVKVTYEVDSSGSLETIEKSTTFSWTKTSQAPVINSITPCDYSYWMPQTASADISNWENIAYTEFYLDSNLVGTYYSATPTPSISNLDLLARKLDLEADTPHELTVKAIYYIYDDPPQSVEKTVTFSFSAEEYRVPAIESISPSGHVTRTTSEILAVIIDFEHITLTEFYLDGHLLDSVNDAIQRPTIASLDSWISELGLQANIQHELTVKVTYQTDSNGTLATVEESVPLSWPDKVFIPPTVGLIAPCGHSSGIPTTASAIILDGDEVESIHFYIDDQEIATCPNTYPYPIIENLDQIIRDKGFAAGEEHILTVEAFYQDGLDNEGILPSYLDYVWFSWSEPGEKHAEPIIDDIIPYYRSTLKPKIAAAAISNYADVISVDFLLDDVLVGTSQEERSTPFVSLDAVNIESQKEHDLTVKVSYMAYENDVAVGIRQVIETKKFIWGIPVLPQSDSLSGTSLDDGIGALLQAPANAPQNESSFLNKGIEAEVLPLADANSDTRAVTFTWDTDTFGATGELRVFNQAEGGDMVLGPCTVAPGAPVSEIPLAQSGYQMTFTQGTFVYTVTGTIAEDASAITIGSSFEGVLDGIDTNRFKAGETISFYADSLMDDAGNTLSRIEALSPTEPVELTLTFEGLSGTFVTPLEEGVFAAKETLSAKLPKEQGIYSMRLDLIPASAGTGTGITGGKDDKPSTKPGTNKPGTNKPGNNDPAVNGTLTGNANISGNTNGASGNGTLPLTGDTSGKQALIALTLLTLGIAAEFALFKYHRRRTTTHLL